jgi:DNA end-binding protein Ku
MNKRLTATVSLGVINVRVGVAPVITKREAITFSTLHETCKTPLKQPKWCPKCNKQVGIEDTVSGYEVMKGNFITVTDEEKKAVQPGRSQVIELTKFIPTETIGPAVFGSSYWLIPDEVVDKPYSLLYRAMVLQKVDGLGSCCLWGVYHPCLLQTRNGALMLTMLHTVDQIQRVDFEVPTIEGQEQKLAEQLVEILTDKVDFETDLVSPPNEKMKAMLSAKVEGEKWKAPEEVPPTITTDVLADLKKSITQAKRAKASSAKKTKVKA